MTKKSLLINIIGWIYITVLTVLYYAEEYPYLTSGLSGFIIFIICLCMVMYDPKFEADFSNLLKKNLKHVSISKKRLRDKK